MKAGCAAQKLQFEAHGKRDVVADFDGGRMTSDGGGLLLREANCCLGDLMARLGSAAGQCGDLEAFRAGPPSIATTGSTGRRLGSASARTRGSAATGS